MVDDFAQKYGSDYYREKTGLPLAPYFSAFKLQWLIQNVPLIHQKIMSKDIENVCFGTIDSWIIFVNNK